MLQGGWGEIADDGAGFGEVGAERVNDRTDLGPGEVGATVEIEGGGLEEHAVAGEFLGERVVQVAGDPGTLGEAADLGLTPRRLGSGVPQFLKGQEPGGSRVEPGSSWLHSVVRVCHWNCAKNLQISALVQVVTPLSPEEPSTGPGMWPPSNAAHWTGYPARQPE